MTLVEEAHRIAPQLAAAVAEGDELRHLPDEVWALLQEGGFLRALQPTRWGGGEVSMHSSSYNPTGRAAQVVGGYRLSGRWSFSSGWHHCHGVNLGAIVGGRAAGIQNFRSFLLMPDQYRVEDNRFTAGLKATGSRDIVVADAFVPEHRTQAHMDYALGSPLPGQQINDDPLYGLPWSVVFNTALATSVLAAAAGFIDMWVQENSTRRFQDVQGGLGHAFLLPDPLAKAVGGALLGTSKPEFVL